jgi:hypothetical protein
MFLRLTVSVVASVICLAASAHAQDVFVYSGRCDASAAAALDADHFIVGNDERNALRVYKRGEAKPVGPAVDLSGALGTQSDKESDIEASAVIGNRIYWMSSHGNNRKGEVQLRRHRFFATDIKAGNPPTVALATSTKPYVQLRKILVADERFKEFKLAEAAELAPEAPGGFNIEGLAATTDGKLMFGFRNPVPAGGALIIRLENPDEILAGAAIKLGDPILLRGLNGKGIRSMELVGSSYLVIAGPPDDAGSFSLHRWSGKADEAATPITGADLKDLRPEAMFVTGDSVQILSDDGGVKINGTDCKDLAESEQRFRSITVKP